MLFQGCDAKTGDCLDQTDTIKKLVKVVGEDLTWQRVKFVDLILR